MTGLRCPPAVRLWAPCVFMRFVTAIETSGDGSKKAMVARVVADDAAYQGALDAALGVGWLLRQPSKQRQRK